MNILEVNDLPLFLALVISFIMFTVVIMLSAAILTSKKESPRTFRIALSIAAIASMGIVSMIVITITMTSGQQRESTFFIYLLSFLSALAQGMHLFRKSKK